MKNIKQTMSTGHKYDCCSIIIIIDEKKNDQNFGHYLPINDFGKNKFCLKEKSLKS